jgi:predicted RNA polymerase sigma factor
MELRDPAGGVPRRQRRPRRPAAAGVHLYRVPAGHELPDRLAGVAATVYLLFNEGYSATGGDDPIRADLVEEAMRLGRLLADQAQRRHLEARAAEAAKGTAVSSAGAEELFSRG